MSRLLKDSFLVVGTKIIALLLGFVSSIFFIRLLGPDGKGVLTLIEIAVGFFMILTTFNINLSLIHFIAKEKLPTEKLLGVAFIVIGISLLSSLTVLTVLYFLGYLDLLLPLENLKTNVILLAILLVINEIKEVLSAFLRGSKSFEDLYKSTLYYSFLRLFLFGGLFFWSHYYDNYISEFVLFCLHIVTIIFITLSILRFFKTKYSWRIDFKITWLELRPLLLFSGIGFLTAILNFLSLRIDIWLVDNFLSIEQVGFYAIALGLSEMVAQIPGALRTVLLPYLSSAKNREERMEILLFFSRITVSVTLMISIALFFMADWLVPFIYGEAFVSVVTPFKIILFSMVIFSFKGIFIMYNIARDLQRVSFWSNIVAILILIPFGLFLIPNYGIEGAALAVLISFTVSTLFIFVSVMMIDKLPLRNYFVITKKEWRPAVNFIMSMLSRKQN
ncbi:hypothetical protein EAX61_00145 [Dokdonia sinensis]|uniref:Uncharacterized protein n=1 Tax=Dokdonia sinensis TaxID=2479847 RepID=A0A3M0GHS4_9FLAO|nr:oligosaccharide flippase family protein [Dokdonia sinensis]RMB63838.1 hypothetical protein EAX61_00145 [Dokdonia sinensis]